MGRPGLTALSTADRADPRDEAGPPALAHQRPGRLARRDSSRPECRAMDISDLWSGCHTDLRCRPGPRPPNGAAGGGTGWSHGACGTGCTRYPAADTRQRVRAARFVFRDKVRASKS